MGTDEQVLFDLLQTTKKAEEMENNEDTSTVGSTGLYDEPKDRVNAGGTVDAPWGEAGPTRDGHPQPDHHSDGAWEENKTVRNQLLDKAFDSKRLTDVADQKLIAENFEHGKSGDYSSHSVHLQGASVEKISHPRTATLMEQVRKATGQF